MSKKLAILIHDIIAHPICGILWIVGAEKTGDYLHDLTVAEILYEDETWTPPLTHKEI